VIERCHSSFGGFLFTFHSNSSLSSCQCTCRNRSFPMQCVQHFTWSSAGLSAQRSPRIHLLVIQSSAMRRTCSIYFSRFSIIVLPIDASPFFLISNTIFLATKQTTTIRLCHAFLSSHLHQNYVIQCESNPPSEVFLGMYFFPNGWKFLVQFLGRPYGVTGGHIKCS